MREADFLIVRLHHIIQTKNEEERDLSRIGRNVTATEAAAEKKTLNSCLFLPLQ